MNEFKSKLRKLLLDCLQVYAGVIAVLILMIPVAAFVLLFWKLCAAMSKLIL